MGKSEDWKHGATLALTFGAGLVFTKVSVTAGGSMIDGESDFISVYPKRYAGMGGGMMRAEMEGMPTFNFETKDEEQAGHLVDALNHFAMEGKVS